MKKLYVTSLLIASIFAGIFGNTVVNAKTVVIKKTSTCDSAVQVLNEASKCVLNSMGWNSETLKDSINDSDSTENATEKKTTKKKTTKKKVTKKKATKKKATKKPVTKKSETNTSGENKSSNQNYADEVLKLLNKERANVGLKPLTTTTILQNAAYKRSNEIVSTFAHTRPDGSSCFTVLGDYNISYTAAGENIAAGQKTPSEVMKAWMNSEGHRENILNGKFGKVGIGVYQGTDGKYYWTQLFTN